MQPTFLHLALMGVAVALAACSGDPSPASTAASPPLSRVENAEPDFSVGAWHTGRVSAPAAAATAGRLVDVETGTHEGYDRIVFTFDGALPAYAVEVAGDPVRACGSGAPVAVEGEATLAVRFEGTAAHTEAGVPTVDGSDRHLALPVVRSLHLTCDFEAQVSWAAGLQTRSSFRVLTLDAPPRIVVDVAHAE